MILQFLQIFFETEIGLIQVCTGALTQTNWLRYHVSMLQRKQSEKTQRANHRTKPRR